MRTRYTQGKQLKIPTRYDRIRGLIYQWLRWPYAIACIIGYFLVFAIAAAYLAKAPSFESEMQLIMPGSGSSNNVLLQDIGQVTSQTNTPFNGGSMDPKVNYKEILGSPAVVGNAAKNMGMNAETFGKPKLLLTEQTSIITIKQTGANPQIALQKNSALYDSFQNQLTQLRRDEALKKEEGVRAVLDVYRKQLDDARKNILAFQETSLIVSPNQLEQIMLTFNTLREKELYARAQVKQIKDYVDQLSFDLGVSPNLAGQAFAMQSDPEFQAYLKELHESAALLSDYNSRWGGQHPKVKSERARFEQARVELVNRGRRILGIQTGDILNTINLQFSPHRAQLFSDLVANYAKLRGAESELADLERSSLSIDDKIKIYTREAASLSKLQKEYELAEAIYTSALARLDASKADIFASYPNVQILEQPTLNADPVSPRHKLAVGASLAGCLLITLTMVMLWQRNSIISLLLKKS